MAAGTETVPRKKRNDSVTKIDTDLLRKARHVCNDRDIALAEYLSETLRPHLERDYDEFIRSQTGEPSPKRKRS